MFAADKANNKVDVFDANFNLVTSFTDTTVPAGFAPFGIQDFGGLVYVSFASTSGASAATSIFTAKAAVFLKRLAGSAAQPALGLCHGATKLWTAEQYAVDLEQHQHRDHQRLQQRNRPVSSERSTDASGKANPHRPALGNRVRRRHGKQRREEPILLHGWS